MLIIINKSRLRYFYWDSIICIVTSLVDNIFNKVNRERVGFNEKYNNYVTLELCNKENVCTLLVHI